VNYAVEMGSSAKRGDKQTHRQHGNRISLLLFFQNKKNRLKIITHLYLNPQEAPLHTIFQK
jgi:hypothetical protein